jgi:hypothetical protein
MSVRDRAPVLNPLVSSSVAEAADAGHSLALIRPKNTQFYYRAKPANQIEAERKTYQQAASQGSFFDKQLAVLEPSPYEFRFKFEDGGGPHDYANGDWEAHAMFFNGRNREASDKAALDWMSTAFNEWYAERGMLFCVGNMAKRPQTWAFRMPPVVQTPMILTGTAAGSQPTGTSRMVETHAIRSVACASTTASTRIRSRLWCPTCRRTVARVRHERDQDQRGWHCPVPDGEPRR